MRLRNQDKGRQGVERPVQVSTLKPNPQIPVENSDVSSSKTMMNIRLDEIMEPGATVAKLLSHHFRFEPQPLNPTPYTLHHLNPTPYALHPAPYTLHPTPNTKHQTPYTRDPTPYTLHPAPCTLNPEPCTLNPKPKPETRNPDP